MILTEHNKAALRSEVVEYMHLVASRNKTELEKRGPELIASLENADDDNVKGLCLFTKGITCFFNSNYSEAEGHFRKIFELRTRNANLLGIAHMGLGFTLRSAGNLDEAVTNQVSATELLDPNGPFKTFLPYCFQSLGETHTVIHEYANAISYFDRGLAASKGDSTNMTNFRHHLGVGNCYLEMKEYEKSRFHLTKAYEIKDLPPPIMARIENDLGRLYLETKEYEKAEPLLMSSLAIRQANGLQDAACTSMTLMAEAYLQQNKISEALQLLTRCSSLVDKFQTKWKKLEVLRLMARAYGADKDYEKASECYEQYIALFTQTKAEQERKIFKFKNEQIEKQKQIIADKHKQLSVTLDEIKRLKVDRKAVIFSWITIIILVVISELFIDPLIEDHSYNTLLSLLVKVSIALLFKPLDGLYENLLWKRTMRKAD